MKVVQDVASLWGPPHTIQGRICRRAGAFWGCCYLALLIAVDGTFDLHAETVVLDFDPPAFQNNQVLGWVGNIGFFGNATVFQPTSVTTQTPPYALHTPDWCESPACANAANVLSMIFQKKASEVSLRVGSELMPFSNFFCFPEGTDCGVYARLVAFDGGNVILDTRDIELFSTLSADGYGAPITRELKVTDPYGRISGATLFVGKGTFSHDSDNNPGRAQIDHLRVEFVDSTPPSPPAPPAPPTVQILQPSTPIGYPYRFLVEGTWSAPAGLLGLCVRVNEDIPVLNQFCTNNATLNGSTFSVELYRESLLPAGNVVNVGLVDLLGRKVTVSRPISAQPPALPLVSIRSPLAGIWDTSGATLPRLTGSVYVSGGLAGFCVRISQPSSPQPPPVASACKDTQLIVQDRYGPNSGVYDIALDRSKLQPGTNDVTVFAFDSWGREGHATVRGTAPANIRISGVELTQGSQTFAMLPTSGAYSGARLVKGVRTIVRVFASATAGGPFPRINATLQGFAPDGQGRERELGSTLLPDNGLQTITTGPFMAPLSVRAKPDSAFVFTLPNDWTKKSDLRLRAIVNNAAFSGTIPECSSCGQDNYVDVTQINFEDPLPPQIISPVAIRWRDASEVVKDPPPVETVFSDFRALVPLPDLLLLVRPYVTIIDGSNLFGLTTGIDRSGNCDDACTKEMFGRVANFEISNQPGFTIGITTANLRGFTAPVTYIRFPTFFTWENIAIVSTTSGALPLLLGVAHELMHQYGFLHASASCGDASSQLYTLWPPDNRGRLQGIGMDRRTGSGPKPGTYAVFADGPSPETYDIMSYCTVQLGTDGVLPMSWLSPRYWNDFGKTLVASPSCFGAGCIVYSAPSDAQPSYRVTAMQNSSGEWQILNVTRGLILPAQRPTPTDETQLIGKDSSGTTVAAVSAEIVPVADRINTKVLSADLPAKSLKSISLVIGGKQVAEANASNSVPKIVLLYPSAKGPLEGTSMISLKWTAQDADSDSLAVRVDYSDDDGKSYRPIGLTSSREGMDLPLRLFSATKLARIRLTVSDGFNESEFVSEAFISPGAAPTVSLINPNRDITVLSTATVNLTGVAFDDRGFSIEPDRMQWTVDGRSMAVGSDVLLPRLKPGLHLVELSARDRFDRSGKAGRTITIVDGQIKPVAIGSHSFWFVITIFALIFAVLLIFALLWWLRRSSRIS